MDHHCLLRVLIPLYEEHKISTNRIYAGVHWGERRKIKDSILDLTRGIFSSIKRIESYPIHICYRFSFQTRPLDTLNCAYMAKMFEDSLHSGGIIEDDSPKYVARSSIEVVILPRKENKKGVDEMGRKNNCEDKDTVEITINSFKI